MKEIQDKEGVAAAKLNDTFIKHLARLKEIRKELLDTNQAYQKGIESISKMGDGVSSLSSVYAELKDNVAKSAEQQTQISNSMAEQINRGSEISSRNVQSQTIGQDILANYRDQQSLAVELAQLDESQVIEKAKIIDELGIYNELLNEQLASLDKRTAIGKEFMGINEQLAGTTQEMVDKAKDLSSLSAEQKKILEDQAAVADTISEKFKALEESVVSILSRPTALIGGIVAGLGKVISALGQTTREMGGFVGGLTGAVGQVTLLKTVFPQALDSAKGLSSEFGGLSDTSFQTQLNTNLMATNMGISGQEAAALTGNFARLNGGSAEMGQNLAASTKELAKANGLMPSQIMADVAGSAKAFAEYGKQGGMNIGEAAVAAGKLGVNMSTLTGVTDHLLDFQSSITQELELGAMLGRNVNLNKARELAYQGKIGASVKEALNQMGGIDAFNKMDIFQKRKAAAALGLSTDELQKMSSNMDKLNDDGTMQLSTFESMTESLTAFATGGMGGLITKFGVFLGGIGQAGMGLKALGGMFPKMAAGIGRMWTGMQGMAASIWRGLAGLVMYPINLAKAAAIKVGGMLGIGGGGAAASVATTATDSIADKAKDSIADKAKDSLSSAPDVDKSTGDKLKSLAGGLKEMGNTKVLFGALNLIPTGLGFLAILPGLPGMFGVGALGTKAGTGLMNLGIGLGFMGNGTVTAGAGNLALAGLAFTLMTAGLIGMGGVALLGAAAGVGLAGLAGGLVALGNPAVAGFAAIGVAILGGLSLAMMGVGYALGLAAPFVEAVGSVITSVFQGIATVIPVATASIISLMDSITLEKISGIALLSLAFMGLAGSLYLLGSAGLFALPALLGIAAASVGLAVVAELFGLGSSSSDESSESTALEEGSLSGYESQMIENMKKLITATSAPKDFIIDGQKFGRYITKNQKRDTTNNYALK